MSRRLLGSRKQAKQGVPFLQGAGEIFGIGKRLPTPSFLTSKLFLSPLVLPSYKIDCGDLYKVGS